MTTILDRLRLGSGVTAVTYAVRPVRPAELKLGELLCQLEKLRGVICLRTADISNLQPG